MLGSGLLGISHILGASFGYCKTHTYIHIIKVIKSPYLIKHMTGIPLDAFTSLRNGLDNSGLTPLHVAAFRGDDAVAWLEPQL